MARYSVFISSTQRDLEEYRDALKDVVLRLGYHPIVQENFSPTADNALQECYNKVRQADVFVGIYAFRYGYAPQSKITYRTWYWRKFGGNGETSITEWEYQWARRRKIPMLLYLLDEKNEAAVKAWPAEWIEGEPGQSRLKVFKGHLQTYHVVGYFSSQQDLVNKVNADLAKIKPRPHWLKWIYWVLPVLIVAAILIWQFYPSDDVPQLEPLVAYNPSAFPNTEITQAITAKGNYLWLATNTGLLVRDPTQNQLIPISETNDLTIEAISAFDDGSKAWIVTADEVDQSSRIGQVDSASGDISWADLPQLRGASSIYAADNGTVWVGTRGGRGLYYFDGQEWVHPLETAEYTPDSMNRLVYSPDHEILWTTSTTLLYAWQDNQWGFINSEMTGDKLGESRVDLTLDAWGRLWVATERGLSGLVAGADTTTQNDDGWIECTSDNSPLPAGKVLALATSDDGQVLWAVTERGVARMNLPDATRVLTSCDQQLNWHVWEKGETDSAVFDGDSQGLTLTAATSEKILDNGTETTLWVARIRAHDLKYLNHVISTP